jgi:hypothetical protein
MRMIFVNLPVTDLDVTKAFWTSLGFGFNPQFSDDKAACMIVEENIFVMLITRERFADFVTGEVADPTSATSVLNCLTAQTRAEVDETVAKAIAAGGKPWQPVMEQGPMYGGSFQDVDGHVWELMAMGSQ